MALWAKDDKIQDSEAQVRTFRSCYTNLFIYEHAHLVGPWSFNGLFFVYLQLRDLMAYLEAEKTLQQLSISNEIKDGTVLPMSVESSTSTGTKGKGKKI